MGYIIDKRYDGHYHSDDMLQEGCPCKLRTWDISLNFEDTINYVKARSFSDQERDASKGEKYALTDTSTSLVTTYIADAVSEVYKVLAKRMDSMPEFTSSGVTFTLVVGTNHDDNFGNVLRLKLASYINEYAYYKWVGIDTAALENKLDDIRVVMHHRKHGITRKVTNLI